MPEDKGKKGKKGPTLAPKPALYTEDEWALAHSVPKLLELPSAVEKGSAAAKEKPLATKQAAALWLWQLLGSNQEAKDEALKAKAAEVLSKLVTAPGTDIHVSTHLLGCMEVLASPATDPQAVAVCGGVLATKPPLVPWLLKQLEQSAGGSGLAAAALGVLHAMLVCAETRPAICRIMAGWNQQPLVAALTTQQSVPLLGGRNASAHAAAIIELLCTPPPPTAAAPGAGAAGKDGARGAKSRTASASSKASGGAAGGASGGDGALASVLQQNVLTAGGLPALLKVCTSYGNTAACRCSAVAALHHILATHGHSAAIKQELLAANGLSVLVQIMGRDKLPLACRAAAAGCVYHFLAPQGTLLLCGSTGGQAVAQTQGPGTLLQHFATLSSQPALAATAPGQLASASSRPGTSASLSKSIIQEALQQRRQQHAESNAAAGASIRGSSIGGGGITSSDSRPATGNGGSTSRSTTSSSGAGAVTNRSSAAGGAAAASVRPSTAAAGRPSTAAGGVAMAMAALTLRPAPGDAAASAVAVQHEALLAQWDAGARKGLATCADQAIAAGVVPALLMLCCGLEGPSKGLQAAAAAATAAAKGPQRPEATINSSSGAQAAAGDGHDLSAGSGSGGHGTAATAEARTYVRRSSVSSSGAVGESGHVEVLDSIAEPAYAAEGEEDESASGASDSRVNSAGSGASKASADGGKKKGGKKKSKKPAKLEPAMVEAQTQASAAVKLLALSSDTARSALLSAGALSVLLPLLDGSVSQARWNARQALLSLSLVATNHTANSNTSSSNGSTATTVGASTPSQPVDPASTQLPAYITLDNMPQGHWLPVAPMSMPHAPPMPAIPGRRGDAGAGGGTGGGNRPSSQGRRTSVSNLSSQPMSQASRMSSTSSFMDGPGPNTSAGGALPRTTKGPRASIGISSAAAAGAATAPGGSAAGSAAGNIAAGSRTSSAVATAAAVAGQQQQQAPEGFRASETA